MIVLTHTIRHLSGWLGERWGGAWPLMRSPRDRFTLIALRVRSRIIARSNSAKTEAICAIARPYAWVISKPSPMDTSWMPPVSVFLVKGTALRAQFCPPLPNRLQGRLHRQELLLVLEQLLLLLDARHLAAHTGNGLLRHPVELRQAGPLLWNF
jgi:hypothetical protein